ncbi:hypothetical protein [Natronorarus salvus]|uniref:hypothetical protein n=1 Tax=Natronorarus salvus TaxID=3117733 RepID=UPI002F263AEC
MNHLVPAGEGRWHLPRHAQIVVYDRRERELLTVYDCAATQKPPSAQLLGYLVRTDAAAEMERTPTGYVVKLRESAVLESQGADHFRITGR